MKLFIFLWCFFYSINCIGQEIVFDTSHSKYPIINSEYYSKTDFNVIDSLELWNFSLNTNYRGKQSDSIRPLGVLYFWRNRDIDDGISKKVYGRFWTPFVTFIIFDIADSAYCYEKSFKTRLFSSFTPPGVGGDIIINDKFIFLNTSVCISCERYDTKVDYCRPVINYVFSKVDKNKITTIESLVEQFPIRKGKLPE